MTDRLNLIFRPARAEDKPRVLEFTAHTWDDDDGDYLKDVYDDWLADPQGQFVAVELEGQPVAIGKLTDMGEGELWLEGLRVDPAHRKKGIGEALHNYSVDLAKRLGGRVLRYATGQDNVVTQTFGARTGFEHIGTFHFHFAEASTEFALPEKLTPADLPSLRTWLDSPLMRSARGLYQRLWKWAELSEPRLMAHLEQGRVFGLRGEPDLRAWSIASNHQGWHATQLNHLDGIEPRAMIELARSMRRYAADSGLLKIETLAIDPSPLGDALRDAGYRAEDFTMFVLELKLS